MDVIDTATSHDLPTQERLRHRSSSASIARERLSDALNDIDDFIDSLPGSDVSEDSSLAELPRTPSEDLAPPGLSPCLANIFAKQKMQRMLPFDADLPMMLLIWL